MKKKLDMVHDKLIELSIELDNFELDMSDRLNEIKNEIENIIQQLYKKKGKTNEI